jgi:hypothetical protein
MNDLHGNKFSYYIKKEGISIRPCTTVFYENEVNREPSDKLQNY